ncbi:DUF4125 family protein [Lacrimispora sp.]|uniref:DUF4125 family protein n=1 Tax=Lacrimispora sp. TaxID=2719234 RepID=UPI002FD9B9AD
MKVKEFFEELDRKYMLGNPEEVQEFLKHTIEEHQIYGGGYNEILLAAINELGSFYRGAGKYKESKDAFQVSGIMIKEFIGEDTVEYATNRSNLAGTLRLMGEYEQALEMFGRAREVYEKSVGRVHFYTASTLNNEALIYIETGEKEKAEKCLREALSIIQTLGGQPEVEAITLVNLAAVTKEKDFLIQALDIYKGLSHKGVHYGSALNMLGTFYYEAEDFDSAQKLFQQAKEEVGKVYGESREYHQACRNLNMVMEARNKERRLNGLTLSRLYYEEYGIPMIRRHFADYETRIAAGLAGEGSECLGFDDDLSRDHDWGPSFCMWLTDEDYEEIGGRLQKMYDQLPKEYRGFPARWETAGGAGRTGVMRISDFYRKYTGLSHGPNTLKEWETVPETFLATAVSGEVFRDDLKIFSRIRETLNRFYPEDVRIKKIAARASTMAQSGQYNYSRCLKRGEQVAAAMALSEFTEAVCSMVYLLNRKYMPFYKWAHYGIQYLPILSSVHSQLNSLYAASDSDEKQGLIEDICSAVIKELKSQGLTRQDSSFLLDHCQDVISCIEDKTIGIENIMTKRTAMAEHFIDQIIDIEWGMFSNVNNEGGRASCQEDRKTFAIMRRSQFKSWNQETLGSYLDDLKAALDEGRNLMTEKYARMMKYTAPVEYNKIKGALPGISQEKKEIISQIMGYHKAWMKELAEKYPNVMKHGRMMEKEDESGGNTSIETYLLGELSTYSEKTLKLYLDHAVSQSKMGINPDREILEFTVKSYGYESLERV